MFKAATVPGSAANGARGLRKGRYGFPIPPNVFGVKSLSDWIPYRRNVMRRTRSCPWATILPMLACVCMASSARGASQPIEFMAPTGGEVYLIGQLAQVRLDP